jgi:hypothetical protein
MACRSGSALSAGEAHDNRLAGKLLSRLKSGTMLLADRGYDADWIRTVVRQHGGLGEHPTEKQSDRGAKLQHGSLQGALASYGDDKKRAGLCQTQARHRCPVVRHSPGRIEGGEEDWRVLSHPNPGYARQNPSPRGRHCGHYGASGCVEAAPRTRLIGAPASRRPRSVGATSACRPCATSTGPLAPAGVPAGFSAACHPATAPASSRSAASASGRRLHKGRAIRFRPIRESKLPRPLADRGGQAGVVVRLRAIERRSG